MNAALAISILMLLPIGSSTPVSSAAAGASSQPCGMLPYANPWSNGTLCTITAQDVSNPAETVYTIYNPVVTSSNYEYVPIQLSPGDRISFAATGCVQTGGVGATWKDYVNPSGSNSGPELPGMYHGTVSITGAYALDHSTGLAVASEPVIGWSISHAITAGSVVIPEPSGLPQIIYLNLGYADDGYNDNGYYAHDDGNNDQCKNKSNAQVTVTIDHSTPVGFDPSVSASTKAFDAVSSSVDPNGLPYNPFWGWESPKVKSVRSYNIPGGYNQACGCYIPGSGNYSIECNSDTTHPAPPSCTNEVTEVDSPPNAYGAWWAEVAHWFGMCDQGLFGKAIGHLNWVPATYIGKVTDYSYSTPYFGDDDISFFVQPDSGMAGDVSYNPSGGIFPNGVAPADQPGIETEQDAGESLLLGAPPDYGVMSPATALYPSQLSWWNSFVENVYSKDDELGLLKNHDAVVTGLLGLDGEHDSKAELHPVFVFAVRETEPGTSGFDPTNDKWAIYARNYGDEGMCSSQEHFFDSQTLDLLLPRPSGLPAVPAVGYPENFFVVNGVGAEIAYEQTTGSGNAEVAFHLPATAQPTMFVGEVGVDWTGTSVSPQARKAGGTTSSVRSTRLTYPKASKPANRNALSAPSASDIDAGSPEMALDSLYHSLTPAEQAKYRSLVGSWDPQGATTTRVLASTSVGGTPPPRNDRAPHVSSEFSALHVKNVAARILALCVAAERGQSKISSACGNALPASPPVISTYPGAPPNIHNPVVAILKSWPARDNDFPWFWVAVALAVALVIAIVIAVANAD